MLYRCTLFSNLNIHCHGNIMGQAQHLMYLQIIFSYTCIYLCNKTHVRHQSEACYHTVDLLHVSVCLSVLSFHLEFNLLQWFHVKIRYTCSVSLWININIFTNVMEYSSTCIIQIHVQEYSNSTINYFGREKQKNKSHASKL